MSKSAVDNFMQQFEKLAQLGYCEQSSLAVSLLPRKMTEEAKAELEQAGVTFLGPEPTDDLFQRVALPPGWTMKPTEHLQHCALCDEHGKPRALIFLKAALYDRRASLILWG